MVAQFDEIATAKKMKIMIVPMAAMAETHGPASRCRILAKGFRDAGVEVFTCMAEDVNYKAMEGITSKKTVDSFDQVLRFTGNLDYKYLRKSVASIRKAIQESMMKENEIEALD